MALADSLAVKNDESAKWRAMTTRQLTTGGIEKFNGDVHSRLTKDFESMLHQLGYDVDETELRKKLKEVVLQAISFAQLAAGQRAIFRFYMPTPEHSKLQKEENDGMMTNIDGEFPELQEELVRDVWFVVKPGLVKWGTGTGENLDTSVVLVKSYVELVE